MFCGKCGAKVNRGERFCGKCGAVIDTTAQVNYGNNEIVSKQNPNKTKFIVTVSIVGIILIGLGIMAYIFFTTKDRDQKFEKGLETGTKYLSELKYDDAIMEFTKAIEIKPKEPETYLKLADLYTDQENYDEAIQTLEQGLAETQSEDIQTQINELKEIQIKKVEEKNKEENRVIKLNSYYEYNGKTYYVGNIYEDDWINIPIENASKIIIAKDIVYYTDSKSSQLISCNIDGSNRNTITDKTDSNLYYHNNKLVYTSSDNKTVYIYDINKSSVDSVNVEGSISSFNEPFKCSNNDDPYLYCDIYCKSNGESDLKTISKFDIDKKEFTTLYIPDEKYLFRGVSDNYLIFSKDNNQLTWEFYKTEKNGLNKSLIYTFNNTIEVYADIFDDKLFLTGLNSELVYCDLKSGKNETISTQINHGYSQSMSGIAYGNETVYFIESPDESLMSYNLSTGGRKEITKLKDTYSGKYNSHILHLINDKIFVEKAGGNGDMGNNGEYYYRINLDNGQADMYYSYIEKN